ncbi:MAG: deaminase [Candidatus Komeilibacteria bacterium]
MKIVTISNLARKIRPYTVTLVGDVFDLISIEHIRFLQKCSQAGRPLIVVVQADKTAKVRLGFNRPIFNQRERAETIAALEFVDFVLILEKPSDYDEYLKIIKPRIYVYPTGIAKHRKYAASLISTHYPKTKVIFIKSHIQRYSIDQLIEKVSKKRDYARIKNPITRRLYFIADNSKARVGRISALMTLGNRIVAESDNLEANNMHAEHIVIEKARKKHIDLRKSQLYVLIPPCILCAQEIIKNKVPKVYYLHSYGNDDGLALLKDHGIFVKKMK